MAQNLKVKVLAIVAVTLACIYGIIGIPTSVDSIKENFQKNIHLGLDLKGGSQLVMQIQVQDAFKTEADTVIQRLRQDLNDKRIRFTDIVRNDPQTVQDATSIAITISGVGAIPQERTVHADNQLAGGRGRGRVAEASRRRTGLTKSKPDPRPAHRFHVPASQKASTKIAPPP